jgi:hypothetical protein
MTIKTQDDNSKLHKRSSRECRKLYQIVLRDSLNVIPRFSPRCQASHDNERVESVLSQ